MPWFGSTPSLKYPKKRTYWVAREDAKGGMGGKRNRAASHGRLNDTAPPAGILKRSGRSRSNSESFQFEDGMVPQEMAAAVPMPSEQKVNAMFAEMVDELGLSRELMFKLPLEKRWELYLSKQKEQQSAKGVDPQPEYYIDKIAHLIEILEDVKSPEAADVEGHLNTTSALKTALRTQPLGFVLRFIGQNGLEQLLVFLKRMNNPVRNSQLHHAIIGCVKALMNSPDGRAHVLVHPDAITVIAHSLKTSNTRTKILVLEILGALCLVPGGHKKVLNAMEHFQVFAVERIRFQTLLVDLSRSLDEPQDSANLQIAVLSFFNALINYKAGEESLEFRMHLRHELLLLGILPIIDRLRALNIAHLNRHLEIFELVQIEDEKELATRLETIQVDSRSLEAMVDLLRRKTMYTAAHSHVLSLVYHCLLLPIDDPHYAKYWHLIDRLVQQVVLQQSRGVDPDSAPLSIKVDSLVQHLLREDEIKAIQWEAEEVKKEREQFRFKLRKKEWEFDSAKMECEQYKNSVERLRQRLHRKASELNESWMREQSLQDRLQQAMQQSEEYRHRVDHFESLLKEKNISLSSLPPLESFPLPLPPPPPPPPPPFLPLPPPPPPPLPPSAEEQRKTIVRAPQIRSSPPSLVSISAPPAPALSPSQLEMEGGEVGRRKQSAPKPSQALKSFNWAKIPDFHAQKTIWGTIDDSSVHQVMDFKQFEETFSAYQRKDSESTLTATLRRRSLLDRPKELSVIESKKAQNCSIVLSNLKMSNAEVRTAVMNMDKEGRLSKDAVEQLLKYLPTPAERELLESHTHEAESFARPDRFLLEMSRVPRYSQRVKSLFFKKTLSDRVDDVRPRIDAVRYTCKELLSSHKLKTVLEVVLAFGNFMNRGKRGNAFGFRLSSLNKMGDTKSSSDRDVNLLHYLIITLESKFPDALALETELPHIKKASKVDLKELQKEFADMQMDLRDLDNELEFQRRSGKTDEEDLFVSVMEEFAADVRALFADIESLITETKSDFHNTLLFFGEDPNECTTEEFFGIFTTFLHSFNEAHVEMIAVRKRREEEEKRRGEMERQKQMTLERRKKRQAKAAETALEHSGRENSDFVDKAELDDLIAVLKSGDYFDRRKGRRSSSSLVTTSVGISPRNSRVLEVSRERLASSSQAGAGDPAQQ